jgi:hypothetical protein
VKGEKEERKEGKGKKNAWSLFLTSKLWMIPSQRCFTCYSKYTRHKPFGQQYQAAAQTDGQTWKKNDGKNDNDSDYLV